MGNSQFSSFSQEPNDLKIFRFEELKVATRNFSHSCVLGEGGFGCVYSGTIKNPDSPNTNLDIAVKQLSRKGMQVVGTIGYAAPEYVQTSRLTLKTDIWSYGIVLYELIISRRPMDQNRPKSEQKLLNGSSLSFQMPRSST